MNTIELYNDWLSHDLEDNDIVKELNSIKGDESKIYERFYKNLEFGTGGLRGLLGAGTNRMNIYTVRKSTQGLSFYLNECFDKPTVAISYDSRIKSYEFAKQCAMVLAGNGIKSFLYKTLMPTPCLSFAVRELNCAAGIMVTASHNPSEYNGYKVYGSDGCQITIDVADKVLEYIDSINIFNDVKYLNFDDALENNFISYISDELIEKYYQNVLNQSLNHDKSINKDLRVVYTPLNGAGNLPVRQVLSRIGIDNLFIVSEQENPDGNFPTCPYPNPEVKDALDLGIKLCVEKQADIVLATDPDCDRVGIALRDNSDNCILISGNELGILLFNYICERRKISNTLPENPVVIKTIVTTDMVNKIAESYGVQVINVLTGFKFIGEQIAILEAKNQIENYIFGFEESYGYLSGTYVRDKDAVVASMLICEMISYYKQKGLSLLNVLDALYSEYGRYYHTQQNFTFEGSKGMLKMQEIMKKLRDSRLKIIGDFNVNSIDDYMTRKSIDMKTNLSTDIHLPTSDVIAFNLDNNSSIVIRPSGTEPKIKLYYSIVASSLEKCKNICSQLEKDFNKILGV